MKSRANPGSDSIAPYHRQFMTSNDDTDAVIDEFCAQCDRGDIYRLTGSLVISTDSFDDHVHVCKCLMVDTRVCDVVFQNVHTTAHLDCINDLLRINTSIKQLYIHLSGNIEASAIDRMTDAIAINHCAQVDMDVYMDVPLKHVRNLLRMYTHHPTMESIDINQISKLCDYNMLAADVADHMLAADVADLLVINQTIQEFHMGCVWLRDDMFAVVLHALAMNRSVTKCNVRSNVMLEHSVSALRRLLMLNTNIACIHASYFDRRRQSWNIWRPALDMNQSVAHMIMIYNDDLQRFFDHGFDPMFAFLRNDFSLPAVDNDPLECKGDNYYVNDRVLMKYVFDQQMICVFRCFTS